MAAPSPESGTFPQKLSHRQRGAALKKERRKKRRQELARLRDAALALEEKEEEDGEDDAADEEELEAERRRQNEAWLQRERQAQEEFRRRREHEEHVEAARRAREELESRLRAEGEEQRRVEREEEARRLRAERERAEAKQRLLAPSAPWRNPEPPAAGRAACPFYIKTGACRFGERCSRRHEPPASSPTLLVRGMFTTFGMEQCRRDDYDPDASLEYSDEETYQQFLDFYDDVLPEFRNVGRVVQFKVSCNLEPHLRGNVYVQYQSEEECQAALAAFNGRWYAGRRLQCELCPVTRWKMAICGLFELRQCPRGKHCNFLHVFRNPNDEFWEAVRNEPLPPEAPGGACAQSLERRPRPGHHSDYHSRPWHAGRERSRSHRERAVRKYRSKSRESPRRARSRGRKRARSPAHGSRSRSRRQSRSFSRSRSRSQSRGRRRSKS
ncbi:U2 small nuclear ribonucleoprotein auxiliary factor 35 kDa subunit-related protein 2-like [Sorex araneus]|uniref:U2 small nuclear ribonucleoprotein auxiliary factor 35 kDa subunit-related protein 2-like n=1 Tax=Sorex araneus TaxID=42254 RepID=UPI002433F5BA|nr:U2 small nuclear ribonucleoprotein auxiliary factor 35 kDa subunit-related protein 2-like [Sorex araneus]